MAPDPTATAAPRLQRWFLKVRHILVEADHFSFVNKYLPWRYALGSLAMAAVAAALCGLYLHVQAYVLLIGIGAVMALGLIWPWVSLAAMRAELTFESRQSTEGEATHARLAILNWKPAGAWGLRLTMAGPAADAAGDDTVVSLAVAPGWRRTEFAFAFAPPTRGVYPASRAELATAFPFGLLEARRAVEVPHPLVVWPATFPLGGLPEAAASDRSREGLVSLNKAGQTGDVFGTRPYVRGDSLRKVHWPQTARHGQLIICERQASACTHLQVVVDLDPSVHAGRGTDGSREWAIRVAASLAECFLGQGSLVEAVIDDRVIPTGLGQAQRGRILDALARVEAGRGRPLAEVLAGPACRRFRQGLQAVVTTDRSLAALAPTLIRGHATHLVVLRAGGFEPGPGPKPEPGPLPVRPWIEITGPVDIPGRMRQRWREVLCAN